jgi:hypothetical protein
MADAADDDEAFAEAEAEETEGEPDGVESALPVTVPSRMFCGFMSRWIMRCAWHASTACTQGGRGVVGATGI